MDSYYLSLLEGAGVVQRERLPGGLGQTQLAAGGSNESGGVVRNVFENCAGGGVNFPVESQFLLDSIPQKSEGKGLTAPLGKCRKRPARGVEIPPGRSPAPRCGTRRARPTTASARARRHRSCACGGTARPRLFHRKLEAPEKPAKPPPSPAKFPRAETRSLSPRDRAASTRRDAAASCPATVICATRRSRR